MLDLIPIVNKKKMSYLLGSENEPVSQCMCEVRKS